MQAGQDLIHEAAVNQQISLERRQCDTRPHGRVMRQRRCGTYGVTGHNPRTCQKGAQITVE